MATIDLDMADLWQRTGTQGAAYAVRSRLARGAFRQSVSTPSAVECPVCGATYVSIEETRPAVARLCGVCYGDGLMASRASDAVWGLIRRLGKAAQETGLSDEQYALLRAVARMLVELGPYGGKVWAEARELHRRFTTTRMTLGLAPLEPTDPQARAALHLDEKIPPTGE